MKPGVGLIGRKLGMTQFFRKDGKPVAVTVLNAGPCRVVQIKEKATDGYRSVQVGFEAANPKHKSKSVVGHFAKHQIELGQVLREFRISGDDQVEPGATYRVDLFREGDFVDVTGTSLGKGFQGGMARWNWKGGPKTHGSMHHRRPGSIGASSNPSRVFKGQHLPGRMGNARVTAQNLEVIQVDLEKNLLLVKGAVPGFDTSVLLIRRARRKSRPIEVPQTPEEIQQAEAEAKKKKAEAKAEKKAAQAKAAPGGKKK